MRKPAEFETHPVSYETARGKGMVRAVVKRVVDGDTLSCFVDAGYYTYLFILVRVADIDTPEVVGTEKARGLEAKAYVERLTLDKPVLLLTRLLDDGGERTSFDRYVADVDVLDTVTGQWDSLAWYVRQAGFDKLHSLTP